MILTLTDLFSSKKRSLRVEAQKQIWFLCRYKTVPYIIYLLTTSVTELIWDGDITFQHCSPLDPDFQIHFFYRWMEKVAELDTVSRLFKCYNLDMHKFPVYIILEDVVR